METQVIKADKSPHLLNWVWIAGIAAILLGTSGIAGMMAWMPTSTGAQAQIPPAPAEDDARVTGKCSGCVMVVSKREIEQPGAAGGVTRDGLNETPGNSTKSYEITVRMKGGSSRVFMDAYPANWRPGERVILIEGAGESSE
jgi:hypothetical protein